MPDIVLIGGGVIGLSIAYELATRGASVRVLDQGPLGQESSWAGAGMITPGNPSGAKSPETRLRAESFVRWPDWAARLQDETGIDTGFARCGGIELSPNHSPSDISAIAAKFQSGIPDLAVIWKVNRLAEFRMQIRFESSQLA